MGIRFGDSETGPRLSYELQSVPWPQWRKGEGARGKKASTGVTLAFGGHTFSFAPPLKINERKDRQKTRPPAALPTSGHCRPAMTGVILHVCTTASRPGRASHQ
jgi:hypothetical protein